MSFYWSEKIPKFLFKCLCTQHYEEITDDVLYRRKFQPRNKCRIQLHVLHRPQWNSPCHGDEDYPIKKFQKNASTRRTQLSVTAATIRLNGSSQVQCQDLSQCWLDNIKKTFSSKSNPSRYSISSDIFFLCAASKRFPMLVRGMVAMLCAFTVGFWKIYKSCLLLLVSLPGLFDTLLHSCQLQGSFYDCLWSRNKGPWHRNVSSACHRSLRHKVMQYNYCFV